MSITDSMEGVLPDSPEQEQSLQQAGFQKCRNQLCNYHISPDVVDAAYQADNGNYTCTHCGLQQDLLKAPGQPGGSTNAGININDQGEIGEGIAHQALNASSFGPVIWWHQGGSATNSAADGAVPGWLVEVKTVNWNTQRRRGIINTNDRGIKLRAVQNPEIWASQMNDPTLDEAMHQLGHVKGLLGVLVLLDFETGKADVFAREMPHDPNHQHGGIINFSQAGAIQIGSDIPFESSLPDPRQPGFIPFNQRTALDYTGPTYIGESPQTTEDNDTTTWAFGQPPNIVGDDSKQDPLEYSEEFNFFYVNGQLHVSADHDHSQLAGHARVDPDYIGPMASGKVTVINQKATWHVDTNMALATMAKILKDYSKRVHWSWGGLTDSQGSPINDDFAPKKSMAADPYWLDNWIERNGPYLYHDTSNLNKVLHEGIKPLSLLKPENYKSQQWPDPYRPRKGHVYMYHWKGNPGEYPGENTVRVDLRKLNHENLNPDEDAFAYDPELAERFGINPIIWNKNAEPNVGLGNWAMRNLHGPAETAWSLETPIEESWNPNLPSGASTIAHKGTIPPEALDYPLKTSKIADYPGDGNMNDMMVKHYQNDGEDLELHNLGELRSDQDFNPFFPKPQDDSKLPDGTYQCKECGQKLPNYEELTDHMLTDHPVLKSWPKEDGKAPRIDIDAPLKPRFQEQPQFYESKLSNQDYWGDHRPAHPDHAQESTGAPFHAVDQVMPDFYDHPEYYMYTRDKADREGLNALMQAHGNPNAPVTIYRATPSNMINNGDWVTASLEYAKHHALHPTDPTQDMPITQATVPAHTLWNSGDSHQEFGYWGDPVGQRISARTAKDPKDSFSSPIPFIYDIDQDNISTGFPGQTHNDIILPNTNKYDDNQPRKGLVQGTYEPGGKLILRNTTNRAYTIYHLADLWYHQHPHLEITGVHMQDQEGKNRKLAYDPIQRVKQHVAMDPAVDNAQRALTQAGGQVHVVGGAVRDAIRGEDPKDIDLMVTGLPAAATRRALEALPGRVDLTGKDFGVFRYKHKGYEVEVALPRRERSTGVGHQDFDVQADHTMTPEEDLARRDFTANAMAIPLREHRLIDPFGGANDIRSGTLRTVGENSFGDDPLRVVRALTANARHGLEPDDNTRLQMSQNAGGIQFLPQERVQMELQKIMSAPHPAQALQLAHETGVLRHILPEVDATFGYDQNNPHHSYDLGTHLLNVLDNISNVTNDPDVRLAALLHDIGKPASAWTDPETGSTHYYEGPNGQGANHEKVGAQMAEDRLRALKFPNSTINRVKNLVNGHMFPAFSSLKGARKFLNRYGEDYADDLMTLREADREGKGTDEYQALKTPVDTQRSLVQQVREGNEPTNMASLAINGNDLINIGYQPGPLLGQKLQELTNRVVEDPSLNSRDTLLDLAKL